MSQDDLARMAGGLGFAGVGVKGPLFPEANAIEPTPEALRTTAKDLRALAGIAPDEQKRRVWLDALRLVRTWALAYARWIELHRPMLLENAPTVQTELATHGWSRYDAMTWLEVARELEVVALKIETNGRSAMSPERADFALTVTQGAKMLQDVVSDLTLANARARVSRAASRKQFETNNHKGPSRRIDRHSFSTWLFEQRNKDLASADIRL